MKTILMPQLQQDMDRDFIFQQDGVPPPLPLGAYFLPHSHGGCLDWTWWNDSSATIITWTFLCGDTLKEKVLVPPLPASFEELWAWITEVVATTDGDKIYRLGMKLVTDGTSAA